MSGARRPGAARALWRAALTGPHIAARLARFGCVGLAAGSVYASVTALGVARLGRAPAAAAMLGYLVSAPVSFAGHRGFSFRSLGRWSDEARRFAVGQALNIAVTLAAMRATTAGLGLSYLWGIAATLVLVPLANFALMNFWVFAPHGARPDATAAVR
jgi:putative flippase GtrA